MNMQAQTHIHIRIHSHDVTRMYLCKTTLQNRLKSQSIFLAIEEEKARRFIDEWKEQMRILNGFRSTSWTVASNCLQRSKKVCGKFAFLFPMLPNLSLCVALVRVLPSLRLPYFPVASTSLPNLFAISSELVHYATCAVNFNFIHKSMVTFDCFNSIVKAL